MAQPPSIPPAALEKLRSGDIAGARTMIEAALASQPDDRHLLELAGFLAGRAGDPAAAAAHLRRAFAADPGNAALRRNLAMALAGVGDLEGAVALAEQAPGDPALLRIAGYAHQALGRLEAAAAAYRVVLAANPADFESWNNLGNVRLALGDARGAADALRRAHALQPASLPVARNFSEALARAERPDERQQLMRKVAAQASGDAEMQTELGLAEAAAQDFLAAERAFRAAIRLSTGFSPAYLELGLLLENRNRIADLRALVEEADARGLTAPEIDFLRAWLLRREGNIAEAVPLAEATPETINPIRRHQLLAELYDRTGDAPRAFARFEAMNAAALDERPAARNTTYRAALAADAERLTPAQVAQWTRADPGGDPPAPVFIVGFPRSGTTLLDTLLTGMPQLHMLEELPVLIHVESALGGLDRLATLTPERAAYLRRRYFELLDQISPPPPGATIVDKHPLHMARIPLIHRLFPDARIILVERHPCDAVLSCFMANFQLNEGMREFVTLEGAARLYDTVFDHWTRATALLPVAVHRVRYERMVADLEGEMRPLLDFLGLPWDPRVLDNRAASAKRDHVRTASYSQITEPIYTRAAGRWTRYRDQMADVLPLLAPWAERMGYEM